MKHFQGLTGCQPFCFETPLSRWCCLLAGSVCFVAWVSLSVWDAWRRHRRRLKRRRGAATLGTLRGELGSEGDLNTDDEGDEGLCGRCHDDADDEEQDDEEIEDGDEEEQMAGNRMYLDGASSPPSTQGSDGTPPQDSWIDDDTRAVPLLSHNMLGTLGLVFADVVVQPHTGDDGTSSRNPTPLPACAAVPECGAAAESKDGEYRDVADCAGAQGTAETAEGGGNGIFEASLPVATAVARII